MPHPPTKINLLDPPWLCFQRYRFDTKDITCRKVLITFMPWFHSSALFSSIKLFFPTTLGRFKFLCTSLSWAGLQLTRGLSREPTASDNASNMFDILFTASRGEILAKIKCARPSEERPASSASWGRWLSVYLTCAAGLKQERKSDLLLALYGFQCCWLIAEGRHQVKSCGKLMYKKFKHVVK